MNLVAELTSQLGITEDQAQGGVGLILKSVQEKLSQADFQEILGKLPNVQQYIQAAPKEGGGLMGALGGLAKQLGVEDLGNLGGLVDGFKKLGLDADAILKFVPKVLEWAQKVGGPKVKELLERVLK